MKMSDFLVERLETARKWTNNLLADIEDERWFDMPNRVTGHVAWQVGHLAASQFVLIHHRCFARPLAEVLPEATRLTFGRGSTPVADRSKYPALAEIRDFFVRTQKESIDLVRTLSEAELESPAGEEAHPLFATKAQAVGTAVMHETFHAGQIAMIRRELGRKALR